MSGDPRQMIFRPAEILLPVGDLRRWSVVACDQFTSDGEYWAEADRFVGDAPSALRIMLPEYYLGRCDEEAAAQRIRDTMRQYLCRGVFHSLPETVVYVERTLACGAIRCGLVGMIDLEAFDYAPCSESPIRATEHTVETRLPPRVKIRREAVLEMPHIMLFLNDEADVVMQRAREAAGEVLYDFNLMGGGGHLRGRRISGETACGIAEQISKTGGAMRLAVGDGNHSLAAAREYWLEKKQTLTPAQQASDPARFALSELVNIHDPAIGFEPIHKVLFETDPAAALDELGGALASLSGDADTCHTLRLVTAAGERELTVRGLTIGQLIGAAEDACQQYLARHGGKIDYIHNDDTAIGMGRRPDGAAILLPRMEKGELFPSIVRSGPFPKKSFSIGHAQDKRYYLECRKIR